jgi:hypothetical protein
MRLPVAFMMALVTQWFPHAAGAQRVTPVPKPSYMIVGSVAGYTSYDLDTSSYLRLSGHFEPFGSTGWFTHSATYFLRDERRSIRVEVQEVGDATWLQHEAESYAWARAGLRLQPEIRVVAGHNLIYLSEEGSAYVWVSQGNKVVHASWNARPPGSPAVEELPEEFVAAYLERLPSDLEPFEFDEARRERWIRNEVERQLYYIAKILPQLAAETDPTRRMPLGGSIIDRMAEIVKIRERYFGGPGEQELVRQLMASSFQEHATHGSRGEGVFSLATVEPRVEELKQWWAEHRNDPITLPTVAAAHPSIATPTTRPREVASEERATVTQPRSARAPGPASTGLSAPTRAVPRPGRLPTEPDEEATAPRPVLVFLAAGAIVLVATWIWWRRSRR